MVVLKYYYFDPRVRRYAESLIKNGVKVDVLCLQEEMSISNIDYDGLRVFTIPLHHIQGSRVRYLIETILSMFFFTIRLLELHFKNQYQIIHVHNMPDLLLLCAIIPKLMGAKLILDIHDPMPEVYLSKYGQDVNSIIGKILILQEKISCFLANAIVTANSNFKANLVRRGIPSNKITVVNNIPNSNIFNRASFQKEHQAKNKYFTLIYPGTFAPRYGLDVPIRALTLLVDKVPDILLLFFGPNSQYKVKLIELAAEIGVSSYTQFNSSIPLEELAKQISLADIGIYPALPDAHMSIATPTKVLEFAIMGVPIVSSRLLVIEDLFTDKGVMLFEPGNIDQFAKCILDLYKNPLKCKELVQNADRIFVQTHFWDREFTDYIGLLNKLLSRKSEIILV